ncbi:MAG: PEP-CTERM sorting domain-containing protein [Gemmataceae bacterium]
MRYGFAFAFAFALVAGNTEARADLITYNMAGTISSVSPMSYNPGGGVPYNVGDHVTWTLQYNPSTPPTSSQSGSMASITYTMSTPVITNIVDQTTGYHFSSPPSSGNSLGLSSGFGNAVFSASAGNSMLSPGATLTMSLTNGSLFPTFDLPKLQLNSMPWANSGPNAFSYSYFFSIPTNSGPRWNDGFNASAAFVAQTTPAASAPEPGSLTLFLLGAAGLAVRRFRSRFGGAVQRA